MTQTELLYLLNAIEFPRQYWELCERFPMKLGIFGNSGRKEDVIAAFHEMDIVPRYDSCDRCFICGLSI